MNRATRPHERWNIAFKYCVDCGISAEQLQNPDAPDYDPRKGMLLIDICAPVVEAASRRFGVEEVEDDEQR